MVLAKTEKERVREREEGGALLYKSSENKEAFVQNAETLKWSLDLGSV